MSARKCSCTTEAPLQRPRRRNSGCQVRVVTVKSPQKESTAPTSATRLRQRSHHEQHQRPEHAVPGVEAQRNASTKPLQGLLHPDREESRPATRRRCSGENHSVTPTPVDDRDAEEDQRIAAWRGIVAPRQPAAGTAKPRSTALGWHWWRSAPDHQPPPPSRRDQRRAGDEEEVVAADAERMTVGSRTACEQQDRHPRRGLAAAAPTGTPGSTQPGRRSGSRCSRPSLRRPGPVRPAKHQRAPGRREPVERRRQRAAPST